MQAHAGALENVLAQRRRLRTDDVTVGVRQIWVETGGQADGHWQGRGRRTRRTVTHADTHWAVSDPETGDARLLYGWHMPLDPDLGGKLIHVRPGFGSLRAQGVDIDGLHGAVQLSDLLLQRHGLDELLGSLARRQGRVLPGEGGFRQGRSPSVGVEYSLNIESGVRAIALAVVQSARTG
jgi:hypothetical protein